MQDHERCLAINGELAYRTGDECLNAAAGDKLEERLIRAGIIAHAGEEHRADLVALDDLVQPHEVIAIRVGEDNQINGPPVERQILAYLIDHHLFWSAIN